MRTKQIHISMGNAFAKKISEHEKEKESVGKHTANVLTKIGPNKIFFGDGTSVAFSYYYYSKQRRDLPLLVGTNNLDIPMQVLCDADAPRSITIYPAPGRVDFRDCAMGGAEAEEWVAEFCKGATCVMAVT